ncbi:sigma E protease regulator RseP [Vibrio sp. JC009]|uniref:sigma E protease regulator RseP n=1 Tax=Vibrio sp. JC009 TaxID=2912314 RepID=UPI0023AF9B48|nr:sigma E protease regulator RseP [Vibrio sp. JC009]WED21177.1 sigma E protease regulator RseP [Vibrio sp. JC009]
MTGFLWNAVSFIIALGILVAVHEYGHFWVARKCGVRVEKFSIGFGRSIWKKIGKDGTEYTISIIPLGGFVKMLDGRLDTLTEEERPFAFDQKPLWQRSAIVSAGPVFNFVFAIFAYWLIFLIGVPAVKPVIGEVTPASIVAEAQITPGMEITSVAGVPTRDWESVNMGLISHIGDKEIELTVAPEGNIGLQERKMLDIRDWEFNPETDSVMKTLGFLPYRPEIFTTIALVSEGGAAEEAGFQVGDKLLSINGEPVADWESVADTIRSEPNNEIKVLVERSGLNRELILVPEAKVVSGGKTIGFAGIAPEMAEWPEEYRIEIKYGLFESVGKAVEKTGQVIGLTFTMLKKLVVGHVGIENLSGPISIAKGAGATADFGLVYFLGFLAMISVNLGIINLMPLPILDGGHLLFYAIEAVIRRPVPEKVQEAGFRIGGAIVFSLMAIAIFNDFMRL